MNLVLKILHRTIQDLLPYDKFPFDTYIICSTSALFTVKFQASSLGEMDLKPLVFPCYSIQDGEQTLLTSC